MGTPSPTLLERAVADTFINPVLQGKALPRQVQLNVYHDDGALDLINLPLPPNAFYGYVPAPERRPGYQIVILSHENSPESDFWLAQCAWPAMIVMCIQHALKPMNSIINPLPTSHASIVCRHWPRRCCGRRRWRCGWEGGSGHVLQRPRSAHHGASGSAGGGVGGGRVPDHDLALRDRVHRVRGAQPSLHGTYSALVLH